MFAIEIPGYPTLKLEHLVLDFNGTLALDGQLLKGVAGRLERLTPLRTACIGNGHNDHLMLGGAALGIAVMQGEGLAVTTLGVADLVVPSVLDALDLLLNPLRLIASLRQ